MEGARPWTNGRRVSSEEEGPPCSPQAQALNWLRSVEGSPHTSSLEEEGETTQAQIRAQDSTRRREEGLVLHRFRRLAHYLYGGLLVGTL